MKKSKFNVQNGCNWISQKALAKVADFGGQY